MPFKPNILKRLGSRKETEKKEREVNKLQGKEKDTKDSVLTKQQKATVPDIKVNGEDIGKDGQSENHTGCFEGLTEQVKYSHEIGVKERAQISKEEISQSSGSEEKVRECLNDASSFKTEKDVLERNLVINDREETKNPTAVMLERASQNQQEEGSSSNEVNMSLKEIIQNETVESEDRSSEISGNNRIEEETNGIVMDLPITESSQDVEMIADEVDGTGRAVVADSVNIVIEGDVGDSIARKQKGYERNVIDKELIAYDCSVMEGNLMEDEVDAAINKEETDGFESDICHVGEVCKVDGTENVTEVSDCTTFSSPTSKEPSLDWSEGSNSNKCRATNECKLQNNNCTTDIIYGQVIRDVRTTVEYQENFEEPVFDDESPPCYTDVRLHSTSITSLEPILESEEELEDKQQNHLESTESSLHQSESVDCRREKHTTLEESLPISDDQRPDQNSHVTVEVQKIDKQVTVKNETTGDDTRSNCIKELEAKQRSEDESISDEGVVSEKNHIMKVPFTKEQVEENAEHVTKLQSQDGISKGEDQLLSNVENDVGHTIVTATTLDYIGKEAHLTSSTLLENYMDKQETVHDKTEVGQEDTGEISHVQKGSETEEDYPMVQQTGSSTGSQTVKDNLDNRLSDQKIAGVEDETQKNKDMQDEEQSVLEHKVSHTGNDENNQNKDGEIESCTREVTCDDDTTITRDGGQEVKETFADEACVNDKSLPSSVSTVLDCVKSDMVGQKEAEPTNLVAEGSEECPQPVDEQDEDEAEEEEFKPNWKVGYLEVKLPPKGRGRGNLKVWKRRWVMIHADDFGHSDTCRTIMIMIHGSSSNSKKSEPLFWKMVSSKKAVVFRSQSRTHRYTFSIAEGSEPLLHMAGSSESESQDWMAAIRAILWPPSALVSLEKMLSNRFNVSVIEDDFVCRAGLLGAYGHMSVTPRKLILLNTETGHVIQEWYLNTLIRFHLLPQHRPVDKHKVFAMKTGENSSTGTGEIRFFSHEALELFQTIAATIHEVLEHRSAAGRDHYKQELKELAEWMQSSATNSTESEEYYKVPPKAIRSLLDIPKFAFDKPLGEGDMSPKPVPPPKPPRKLPSHSGLTRLTSTASLTSQDSQPINQTLQVSEESATSSSPATFTIGEPRHSDSNSSEEDEPIYESIEEVKSSAIGEVTS